MLSIFLLVTGGAVSLYALWQLRRWLAEAEGRLTSAPKRLEAIVDELVATAEEASSAVAERTELLAAAVARADERLQRLQSLLSSVAPAGAAPAPPNPAAAHTAAETVRAKPAPVDTEPVLPPYLPEPAPHQETDLSEPNPRSRVAEPNLALDVPESHRRVYRLADAGQDLTAIARQTGMTKGEVQLILGLRRIH